MAFFRSKANANYFTAGALPHVNTFMYIFSFSLDFPDFDIVNL